MRVLHLGKFYPPAPGGIERVLESLALESRAAGIDTAVLAHTPPRRWRGGERRRDGVRIVEAATWTQWVYAPIAPELPLRLHRLLREFRPDLLHVHVPNTSAFALLGSARARRLPWVVHWHADIPQDSPSLALRLAYPIYRPFETALLRRAAAVIATSPHYRDSSRALAPWREKVSVVPLSLPEPLPPSSAAPMPWPDQPLRLLAVGRLSHYKGFDVLLQALAATPGVGLILVGDGEEEAALRALADRLRLVDRVQFAGHVDDATLHAAYASAHAFCLPSLDRAEAFGMVLLEAMRARLPIVASRIAGSGVNHVLDDGAAGLLVPPADAASLAQALARLRDDADLRRTLADAGNARWRRCFIPARTTPALLDLYRQVLSRT